MAFGNTGNPVRFGSGQTGDDRSLFLKVFGGEVLTAFTAQTMTKGKVRERNIASGKQAQFPRTGTSQAEYLTPGQEMLGNPFATGEVTVDIDGLLVAHHDLFDLDAAMSHFDVRSAISADMGGALARAYDRNTFRSLILSARQGAVSGITPGGTQIVDAALTAVTPDGKAWIDAIRKAKVQYRKKFVPTGTLYLSVLPEIFDAIKYATNAQGFYIVQNRDYNPNGPSVSEAVETIRIEGVSIMPSTLMPSTNETADATVYAKYRANYSTTVGIMWAPEAVAVLSLLGVTMETFRDARRKSDFMSASYAVGHGPLRCECAVEFKTA